MGIINVSWILFLVGYLKFIFRNKNILINLLRLEVIRISLFLVRGSRGIIRGERFTLSFMCCSVSGSCLGLTLFIIFSTGHNKSLGSAIKKILC